MNQMTSPFALTKARTVLRRARTVGFDDVVGLSRPRPARPDDAPARQTIDLMPEIRDYINAILLRKWQILASALICALLAALVVVQIQPVYRSTATVMIDATKSKLIGVEDVFSGVSANREYFQSQAEAMKSNEIAARVIKQLNLTALPEFDPFNAHRGARGWVIDHFPFLASRLPAPKLPKTDAQAEAAALRLFATHLDIEPVRLSQLARITFESHDPELAAAVANEVGEQFIQLDIESRSGITRRAGQSINQRLAELKNALDASEKALQSYRESTGLVDSKITVNGGQGRQLDDLNRRLVEARVRRYDAEESYRQVQAASPANIESMPAIARNPSVQKARDAVNDAERHVADAAQRYGVMHPSYQSALSERTSALANLRRQIDTVVMGANKEFSMARATEQTIEQAIGAAQNQLQDLTRKDIQANALEQEVAGNRQIYQTFLSRFKETQATSELQTASARLIDPAIVSLEPARPAKTLLVLAAALAGAGLAAAAAIVIKKLNTGVHTSHGVTDKLGQIFLSALPTMPEANRYEASQAVRLKPDEHYAEAVRTAGTSLMLSTLDGANASIAITSSVPDEGKSTFAMNLALWLGKSRRVLLVEANMRKPSLSRALRMKSKRHGLAELIAGDATLEECVHRNKTSGMDLLLCGAKPNNPLELLASDRFVETLQLLESTYDVVIIDAPPLQMVSDALLIGRLVTGMVYVVKADDTPMALVKSGLNRLIDAEIPILGVVLNQVDFQKAQYYGEKSAFASRYASERYSYGHDIVASR